jgi:hypothetical protein
MHISAKSVELLRELAVPFDDTVDTVIERLVLFYREHCHENAGDPCGPASAMPAGVINLNPDSPPDLRYTRIIKAVFDNNESRGTNWNEFVRKVIEAAYVAAGRDFEKVRRMTTANMVQGHKSDEGYAPLAHLGISVQGVAANDAFRIVRDLAKKLSVVLYVVVEWRNKEGATHPGEAGQFTWSP